MIFVKFQYSLQIVETVTIIIIVQSFVSSRIYAIINYWNTIFLFLM